jgi:hypothetical protein
MNCEQKQWSINNNSTIRINTTMEVPLQEALFAVLREAYLRCKLGRLKSPATLKMEAISSPGTSILTTVTRCNISKEIHHCYRREKIPEDSVLQPYIVTEEVSHEEPTETL